MQVLQWIVNLGAIVFLPILLFLFGLASRIKPGKAFKFALTIGIGFIGLNLVINLLTTSLGPATKSMISNYGLHLSSIDVGWPAASAIAYGTALGAMAIPVGVGTNIIFVDSWPNQNAGCRYLELLARRVCRFHFVHTDRQHVAGACHDGCGDNVHLLLR